MEGKLTENKRILLADNWMYIEQRKVIRTRRTRMVKIWNKRGLGYRYRVNFGPRT